jgi:hypothetical protein
MQAAPDELDRLMGERVRHRILQQAARILEALFLGSESQVGRDQSEHHRALVSA